MTVVVCAVGIVVVFVVAKDGRVLLTSSALLIFLKTSLARGCPFLSGWTIRATFLKKARAVSYSPIIVIASMIIGSGVSANLYTRKTLLKSILRASGEAKYASAML